MGLVACHKRATESASDDRIISVDSENTEMNAAIEKARSSLPLFWKTFANPMHGECDFNLKVRVTAPEGTEHFWCSDIKRDDTRISGIINNDAKTVTTVHLGQRIDITTEQITDWLYISDGKMVGNYTVRPLLHKMTQEEASEIKARLAELPE